MVMSLNIHFHEENTSAVRICFKLKKILLQSFRFVSSATRYCEQSTSEVRNSFVADNTARNFNLLTKIWKFHISASTDKDLPGERNCLSYVTMRRRTEDSCCDLNIKRKNLEASV